MNSDKQIVEMLMQLPPDARYAFLDTPEGRGLKVEDRMHLLGYGDVRIIDGEYCGVYDYAYTRGIVIGLDEIGVRLRYCYENRDEATKAFAKYTSLDAHPTGNWIKAKGRYKNGVYADDLNPNWSRS